MHRVCDGLVQRRTVLINEICGFLLARVIFAAQPINLRKHFPGMIEDTEQNLSQFCDVGFPVLPAGFVLGFCATTFSRSAPSKFQKAARE
jgi:hypothetical protein